MEPARGTARSPPGAAGAGDHGRCGSGAGRRGERGTARAHADVGRAGRAPSVGGDPRARQGGGHAERRGHGQFRGRAQRAGVRARVRPGGQAGIRGDRRGSALRGRDVALAGGAVRRGRAAAALHRTPVGRQRPQPHRAPLRAPAPGRGGRRARAVRPPAARRPRRPGDQRAGVCRRAGEGVARAGGRRPAAALPHRLGRRAYAGDDGPLRGGLAHRRARVEGARAGRGPGVRVGARGARDLPSRAARDHRPGPPRVRDPRRRAADGDDRRRSRRGVLQLPRRPRAGDLAGLRAGRVRQVRARSAARRVLRRDDAVRRRHADAATVPGHAAGHRPHDGRAAGPRRGRTAGDRRDRSSAT